jgi:hypothetical protein
LCHSGLHINSPAPPPPSYATVTTAAAAFPASSVAIPVPVAVARGLQPALWHRSLAAPTAHRPPADTLCHGGRLECSGRQSAAQRREVAPPRKQLVEGAAGEGVGGMRRAHARGGGGLMRIALTWRCPPGSKCS